MKSYTLEMVGSGGVSEIFAKNDVDAQFEAETVLGPDVVWSEDWDQQGFNDDGQACYRLLAWANEQDADNDDGSHAVAQLTKVGR